MIGRTLGAVAGLLLVAAVANAQDARTYQGLTRLIEDNDGPDHHLVDVRTRGEYIRGAIPSAINIPHTRIGRQPPTQDRDALIVVYCATGIRSHIARRVLERQGYTNVVDFGGITNWRGEVTIPSP